MHPAPSVILFTVLSGAGFGTLFFLATGWIAPMGVEELFLWGLGYLMAVAGLVASTFHLGNPQRALRAYTQWRTSWLSREAWAASGALALLAPVALAIVAGVGLPAVFGLGGAAACLVTLVCTGMIYAQLRTVPRWNHWTTPVLFLAYGLAGGAILAAPPVVAVAFCMVLALGQVAVWRGGDGRFAARGHALAGATGLGAAGRVRPFSPPHTSPNYVMREMIYVVGRKHARKLRIIAIVAAAAAPAVLVSVLPASLPAHLLAMGVHLGGAAAARWLFFAEAEHVVALYYGRS